MATEKSSKTPKREGDRHKARDSDRAYAAELARRYREKDPYQLVLPDGKVFFEQYVDGDMLAMELQHFADNGTWDESAARRASRAQSLRPFYRRHVEELCTRNPSMKKLDAIAKVAAHFGVEFETVNNAFYRYKPEAAKRPKRKPLKT